MEATSLAMYLMLSELGIDIENDNLNERDIQRKIYLLQALGVDFGIRYTFSYGGKVQSKNLMYVIYGIQNDFMDYKTKDPFVDKKLNENGKNMIARAKNIINRAKEINLFDTGEIQFLEAYMLLHFLRRKIYNNGDKEKILKEFLDFKPELKDKKNIIYELWNIV